MNRTTVKRGIGAVILALIAAALLAFLLKDKAAQRQEVVEISLPGTGGTVDTASQTDRLPTLTTDNSGNDGSVIANAGSGSGNDSTNSNTTSAASGTDNSASSASGSNSDGTIIASAAAVGAAGAAAVATTTAAAKNMDFSVKPRTPKASGEFLDLDLVNNGASKSPKATATAKAATASTAAATATQQTGGSQSTTNTDQGIVIASTAPKSGSTSVKKNAPQPRLIGEKRSAPVKSSNTARVISSKKAPAKATTDTANTTKAATRTNTAGEAKNGYAIQLLATSSKTRANNLKNVMSGEGYPAYVTTTRQNGKTLYRVRIGQYARKSQAVQAQSAMKRRYKKNTNVNRSAVVAR